MPKTLIKNCVLRRKSPHLLRFVCPVPQSLEMIIGVCACQNQPKSTRDIMRQNKETYFRLSLKPVLAALLAIFPVFSTSVSLAAGNLKSEAPENSSSKVGNELPDLGKQAESQSALNANFGPGGAQFDARFDRQKIIVSPQYSDQTGMSFGVGYATMLTDNSALGLFLPAEKTSRKPLLMPGSGSIHASG